MIIPKRISQAIALIVLGTCLAISAHAQTQWQPAKGPLMTRFAADVSPDKALPEYPRPQLVREQWQNLNGLWDYAIKPRADAQPSAWDGKLLVPFPIESALSGVMKKVGETNHLWYHRTFERPTAWGDKRTLLHFGAVDWQATVFLNGKQVGTHQGGYTPFTLDITDALTPTGQQDLVVQVFDPTDSAAQPRGKQVNRPSGIWYTSVTGIWQTVWLEPVPATYIESLLIVPDIDKKRVTVTAIVRGSTEGMELAGGVEPASGNNNENIPPSGGGPGFSLVFDIADPMLWTPEKPDLYKLSVVLGKDRKVRDGVSSYFAMRKISLQKDDKGIQRLALNNKPLFQFGPLDQGWWPDGLYTAPTDEALKYDIEMTKKLGFNMARKHVKVEPDRWYYWADTLGLLVWQDMPSGFATNAGGVRRPNNAPFTRTPDEAKDFEGELKEMIDTLRNHPSIVMWVPFNEGWGQYDTERLTKWIKDYDPTRLVNNASGWTDKGVGDVHDMHNYPGPNSPKPEPNRAVVLGEFGGLGLPLPGHTWQDQRNWGYKSFKTQAEVTAAYLDLVQKLHVLEGTSGLSAAVYTQTTDVEIEVNGLMTYDRAIVKPDLEKIAAANRRVYTEPPPPPPTIKTLVPTGQGQPTQWHYTSTEPLDRNWFAVTFDDHQWQQGPAGFGTPQTPNTTVRTPWSTADIWLRRTVELPRNLELSDPALLLFHDEDTEIYINGTLAMRVTGFNGDYEPLKLDPSAAKLLHPGSNTLAIHCHQTTGGQYIDVGIVDIVPAGK
jgi:beta-galactosidase/beta-glucuronidase